jgi:hypothetical protein
MNLQYRIELLSRLGDYMLSQEEDWLLAKERAARENNWFIPEFIDLATQRIAKNFLNRDRLDSWISNSPLTGPGGAGDPKTVGIVMAGNIPLVGFHDWLCVFISGKRAKVKRSSRDMALITHLVEKLASWSEEAGARTEFSEMLKGCDAYIATGSNNSSRYFDHYFGKYPHIIRRNRTAVAVLNGNEPTEDLEKLADDVYTYFGLGCRNVTKIYIPENYDFVPLLEAFRKYTWMADHHKYKNNYDYNLAIQILNKKYYMTNGSILLIEDKALFSPISQLNYEFYPASNNPLELLKNNTELQCIVGAGQLPFGSSQEPSLSDYADGIDTMGFLAGL